MKRKVMEEFCKGCIEYSEKELKKIKEFNDLSENYQSLCLALASCLCASKLIDKVFYSLKEIKNEFYDKFH